MWQRLSALLSVCLLTILPSRLKAGPSLGLPVDIIANKEVSGAFPVFTSAGATPIYLDGSDYLGVTRAATDLCEDIQRVGGARPSLTTSHFPAASLAIIIGSYERSDLIKKLAAAGKIPTADIAGRWESFSISVVNQPLAGVGRALVIAGSDKRGTIYGIYELSEQLGVSPWYWWADVPPKKQSAAYVLTGHYSSGEPVVKYRGIFLNDEAPCLSEWTKNKFGGFNSTFYTKVFELLLRMRGNFLWPAMWNNAFNVDDPENPKLADEYGIVMGTSHHEPMMRAHKEWTDHRGEYGNGEWNYATNADALFRFFREGIARNKNYENFITIGMRGDGDEGMVSTGSIESDILLLKKIISDQRSIISEETHRDPSEVPQLWALFTEVQKYYEHGLRPPDDVTLLWTDDNTGNLRRLPTADERLRRGGAGIYYHFDMHGGPFSYQWINTNPFPKIAEQMHLAAEYGATRVWIANVGDLKPLELPIEFFLRMAWNPNAMTGQGVAEYTRRWAERDFGPEHASEIADLVARYTKYNGWRKPELVHPDTYSQINFGEADRVDAAWRDVVSRAEALSRVLPVEQRDAFYELVFHPAKASALVTEMNIAAGRNQLSARQGRVSTSAAAAEVRQLFEEDRAMSAYYNHTLAGGKWNHLMDQTHLGEYEWEPPVADIMPPISEIAPRTGSDLGVSIEGSPFSWPNHFGEAVLPSFNSFQPRPAYFDVFAMDKPLANVAVTTDQSWISTRLENPASSDHRYLVTIDWTKAPEGKAVGEIVVKSENEAIKIKVVAFKAKAEELAAAMGRFGSLDGPIAFATTAATTRTEVDGVHWETLPDYGRGEAALEIYPVTAKSILPPAAAPQLQYPLYLPRSGTYEVTLVLGPVMDFVPDRGMRIAVSMDDEKPTVLDIFAHREAETFLSRAWWNQFTRDNARFLRSSHAVHAAGPHTLKITMVDPGIVLEKIMVYDRPIPNSYFGPLETQLVK